MIQEHYARSHHFDLRLEREGVLISWAVPKGMPTDTKKNRLAMRVEDHALSHLDFVDESPVEGVPGAVKKPHGERLEGRYAIFRTGGSNWLVHRMRPTGEDDHQAY